MNGKTAKLLRHFAKSMGADYRSVKQIYKDRNKLQRAKDKKDLSKTAKLSDKVTNLEKSINSNEK